MKNSKAITIVSVNFLMRPDGKKYLEVDKLGSHSPGLVAGAREALTRAFTTFDSCPIKLNQPGMHSPLILSFISPLKVIRDIELTGAVHLLELQALHLYLIFCLHLSLL